MRGLLDHSLSSPLETRRAQKVLTFNGQDAGRRQDASSLYMECISISYHIGTWRDSQDHACRRNLPLTPSKLNFQHVGLSESVVVFLIWLQSDGDDDAFDDSFFKLGTLLVVWVLKMTTVGIEFGAAFIERDSLTESSGYKYWRL